MPFDGKDIGSLIARRTTHDMQTYDTAPQMPFNERGDMLGKRFHQPVKTHDGRMADSTGAFFVGELERLDPTLHEPLVSVSWSRDIDLREDVTIGDEATSFTVSSYGSAGGLGGNSVGNGKAWSGRDTTQISGVSVDIAKTPHPLRPWALEVKYTIFELESAANVGRPIDQQKLDVLQLKHQMDIDEQAYYGDSGTGDAGLMTNSLVPVSNIAAGGQGATQWVNKTPDEILGDFNTALTTVWAATSWSAAPTRILLPPAQYGFIAMAKVSNAGNVSVLEYLAANNIVSRTGKTLEIFPIKWGIGAGQGGTIGVAGTVDRMVAYTKEKKYVRLPLTTLSRTPVQFDGIYHKTTYYCRIGVVEFVYPETAGYFDGL